MRYNRDISHQRNGRATHLHRSRTYLTSARGLHSTTKLRLVSSSFIHWHRIINCAFNCRKLLPKKTKKINYIQLLSDRVLLIGEGDSRHSSVGWLALDGIGVMRCQVCILVEGKRIVLHIKIEKYKCAITVCDCWRDNKLPLKDQFTKKCVCICTVKYWRSALPHDFRMNHPHETGETKVKWSALLFWFWRLICDHDSWMHRKEWWRDIPGAWIGLCRKTSHILNQRTLLRKRSSKAQLHSRCPLSTHRGASIETPPQIFFKKIRDFHKEREN